jgi:uncharacterized protein (TIGR01777 family)
MNIAITGASGLIGSALVRTLHADGHQVRRLVRRAPRAADEAEWDPAAHTISAGALDTVEAVVHLAGLGIGDRRWNEEYKRAVLASRVDGTTTIAEAVAERRSRIKVFVSASAVGWYGDRGDDVLTEAEGHGAGFLAEVVRQWEAATLAASDAGVRTVTIRTGIVLSPSGGALGRMLPVFRAGLGGRLGSGRQWMPWIALSDELAAIRFLLRHDSIAGPVNLCAPDPVRNREFTAALGRALHRPALAVVPRLALKVAFADFADEGLLVSQRVIPEVLFKAGFDFGYSDIDAALQALV